MKNRLVVGILALLAIAVFVFAGTPAYAQATRTWVSGVGDDANPCSRTAPCKTFAGSISKTAPGGEINVLDPGGFGAVTITKSITISSQAFEGGVLVSGTNGIVIQVPNATDTVILRGLDIEGLGTGISGILVNTGGNVFVENTSINNFTDSGIKFIPTVTGSSLHVSNCYIRDNGNFSASSGQGILIGPTVAASVDIELARLTRNVVGLVATGGTTSVTQSVVASNAFAGIAATASPAIMNVEKSVVTHNNPAVRCNSGTVVRLGNNSITDNASTLAGTGTCQSFKNNDIDVAVAVTPINPQ
jgi:hypothetical protein